MKKLILAATALAGIAGPAMAGDMMIGSDSFAAGLATGAALAPGEIKVRLGVQMWVEGSYETDTTTKVSANQKQSTTGKNSGVFLGSYIYMYPKFSAKAENGLEYGAMTEIRMNSGSGAGSSSANTLYLKRYYGYVGTAELGRLYLGPWANAYGRLASGTTMEDFDYNGGFNGDYGNGVNSNANPNWTSLKSGGFYTSNQINYVSPSFSGFSFGFGWEPEQAAGEPAISSGGTLNPTTASYAGNSNLRRNTINVAAGYKGSVGPVAITSFVGYMTAGRVLDTRPGDVQYKNFSALGTGARFTIGPVAFGGTINGGNFQGTGGMERVGQKPAFDAIYGAQYILGQLIVGFQGIVNTSAGSYNAATPRNQLHEWGVAVGFGYDVAPGMALFGDVFYEHRHQYGYDFVAGGSAPTNALTQNNNIQGRGIQLGTTFMW